MPDKLQVSVVLMNRIRFAMCDTDSPKLGGTVECDETYIGPRKPRYKGTSKRGRGTSKIPVFCAVERGGEIRRRVVANVTAETIGTAIREEVDKRAHLMTDEFSAYTKIGPEYASHQTVCHATKEYACGDVHVNTAESSHALVKRGIIGIYHNISSEYLHRYLWQYDFLWNNRKLNDGERTILCVQSAEGKRLMYKPPITKGN